MEENQRRDRQNERETQVGIVNRNNSKRPREINVYNDLCYSLGEEHAKKIVYIYHHILYPKPTLLIFIITG